MTNKLYQSKIVKHYRLKHDELGYWQIEYQSNGRWYPKWTENNLESIQHKLIKIIEKLPDYQVAIVDDTIDLYQPY